ncbi:MAG: PEGA domain-containing protein [Myxococcaceae bacterium]|nr:PEGA domain-containing protein [Myxococcaceae bacterium]MCA3013925.1 PEGA domain-containing protein [Myxococcaceae bacterium]
MRRLTSALLLAAALPALAQDAETKPKLTVVPFALLSADVSTRASQKAVGMLSQEFKSAEKFELVEAKKREAEAAFAEALAEARKLVTDAQELRARRKFRLADEALGKALALFQQNVAGLTDVAEVADAHALRSAVQYNTGRDEEGLKSLTAALALAPDRELPLAQTSPLFARVVADTRKALKEAAKGQLVIESTPGNASVLVDGLALGSTPLTVRDVPPGVHFWRAALPNGEVQGGTIEVVSGKQALVRAVSSAKDPESRLLAAVAQNKVDADAVAAAKDFAGDAQAELLVFGGLSTKAGKGLQLDAFVYVSSSNEVRRLPQASFDAELLNAGMEFYNLAGEVAKKGKETGELVKVPASVSFDLAGQSAKAAEVKYGVVPGKAAAAEALEGLEAGGKEPGKDDGPRKPLGPRAPLKRK